MFDDSFDERSELFGSPQPLAEESIARTSTLNSIALSCQGGSFASMHSAAEALQEVGAGGGRPGGQWQEASRRWAGWVNQRVQVAAEPGGRCQRAR